MTQEQKPLSRYWLLLGVTALAVAGLYSLVLVVARTPALAKLPGFSTLFHEALVVHVDLSVLVWFLAIACLMWSLLVSGSKQVFPFLEEAALICFALGTLAIAASPLDPASKALMSNYIPVIMSPVFFIGLSLLLCGMLLMLARLFTADFSPRFDKPLQFGLFSAGIIAAVAIMAFFLSYHGMPREIDGQQYYELVFWGGGHVLQFVHVQIMLVGWILMLKVLKPDTAFSPTMLYSLFSVGLAAAFATPLTYVLDEVHSSEHRNFFIHTMIVANGVAPTVLLLFILPAMLRHPHKKNALWSVLFMSLLLFIYGGVLGLMIEGQNVVIPAHYHGSIVGVTLAFMGMAYALLPEFGWRDVRGWKLAYWQPIVYGGGQLLHISGLAWSGGYGVLRKTPGGMDAVEPSVKIAMGMMGGGGLLAILGGFMFVVVIAKAVFRRD